MMVLLVIKEIMDSENIIKKIMEKKDRLDKLQKVYEFVWEYLTNNKLKIDIPNDVKEAIEKIHIFLHDLTQKLRAEVIIEGEKLIRNWEK